MIGRARAVVVALAAALAAGACTDDAVAPPPLTVLVDLVPMPGFGSGTLVVDGTTELPVMVADTDELRARGLMSVADLGPWAGMVFVWDSPTDGGFWMKHTLIPLSIYWFTDDGEIVATAEMLPCPPDAGECPRWRPGTTYTHALEIAAGTAEELGLTSVSHLELRR